MTKLITDNSKRALRSTKASGEKIRSYAFDLSSLFFNNRPLSTSHHPQVKHTPDQDIETGDTELGPGMEPTSEAAPDGALSFEMYLPFAAKAYDLSPNPQDYFFRPVPAIISDIPNRNGVAFPIEELLAWNVDRGCQTYKSWQGMPMYEEHGKYHPDPDEPDPRLAIGIIADVALTPLRGFGNNKLWKVMMLAAIDRTVTKTRTRGLVQLIEEGKQNTYSMGALVMGYTCSYCGAEVGKCSHIDPKKPVTFYERDGQLVFKQCRGVTGAELSSVGDPAVGAALSDVVDITY